MNVEAQLSVLEERLQRCQAVGYPYAEKRKQTIHRCNVCGCIQKSLLTRQDRYGFDARFVQCDNCGCVWLAERMSAADYRDFYEHWYRRLVEAYSGREMDTSYYEQYSTRLAKAIGKHLAGQTTCVDIGGSTGIVASTLRDMFGLQCTVADPNSTELAAAKKAGHEIIPGTIDDVPAWRRWDVVLMAQTIEHLLDPLAGLKKMRAICTDDGVVVVDACRFDLYQSSGLPIATFLKIDHPYYFTDYAMKWLINAAGLRLVHQELFTQRNHVYVCRTR